MSDLTWTNDIRRLSDLVPWEHNPKRMTKKQAEGLRLSIEKFGFAVPFLVSPDGDIYDGHQRQSLMAAIKEYGPNATVDVRVSSRPLTDDERRELVVRLKQNQAGWDFDMLPNLYEREELLEWGFEPEELGMFPADDVPEDPGPQIDKAEELREKWGVETGQLWQLGEHRLICGDCTDAAVVGRVMGGDRADTLVFDPEWDVMPDAMVDYASTLAFCDGATLGAVVERYGAPAWLFAWDCVTSWYTPNRPLRRMKLCAWYGDVTVYQFDGWHYGDAGNVRDVQNTRGEYTFRPDPRGKHLSDVYQEPITRLHADSVHSHSKPSDWLTLLIANCTTGDVFDPYSGSGTTLIACERLGRRCRAVEISPGYVAVALERWATMTGQEPVLLDVTG